MGGRDDCLSLAWYNPAALAGASLATYSDLQAVYITPSVAWRPIDTLSIGVGANVVAARAELQRTGSVLKGDDCGYGGSGTAFNHQYGSGEYIGKEPVSQLYFLKAEL